jgi:NAD(P)-dependent dehydrogenase (short-subunit alcohol dehydrogenase family)
MAGRTMSQPFSPEFPTEDSNPLSAFERIHRQMAEAHMATQRALADNHAAYLRASEMALRLAAGHLPAPTEAPPLDHSEAPDVGAPVIAPASAFEPAGIDIPPVHSTDDAIAEPDDIAPDGDGASVPADSESAPVMHHLADEPALADVPIEEEPAATPILNEPIANEPLWYEPAMPELAIADAEPPAVVHEEAAPATAPMAENLPAIQTYEPVYETIYEPVAEPSYHPAEESADEAPDEDPRLLTPEYTAYVPPPAPSWSGDGPTIEYMPDAIPEPEPAPPALRRLAFVAQEEAAPGSAMPGLRAGSRIHLAGGPEVIRNAIGQALTAAGLELAAAPEGLDALISLHGLTENTGPHAAHEAALGAFNAAQAVAAHPPAVFIAVQDGGGDFGLSGAAPARAWTAGFAAFTRTIAREWPACATKTIDISEPDPDRLAMRLTRELVFGGPEDMVGLTADNRRLVPREAELHAALATSLDVDDDAVIIVSGGARGITASCLASLCHGRRLRLTLLGRTPFDSGSPDDNTESPGAMRERLLSEAAAAGRSLSPAELLTALGDIRAQREVRDTIAQLTEAGADIRYFAIDINDAAAVAAAVERTRNEFGRIDGVIHAAGIIADRRIADKTEAQFARVFATKVEGLANLIAATAEDKLRLLVMFGSLAGRYGNLGQADYALANATLAAVARAEAARRGATCLVKSIAWGPWDGGMLDASLKSSFARHDVAAIEQASGAAAFLAELAQPAGDVVSTDIVFAPAPEETQAYSDAAQ